MDAQVSGSDHGMEEAAKARHAFGVCRSEPGMPPNVCLAADVQAIQRTKAKQKGPKAMQQAQEVSAGQFQAPVPPVLRCLPLSSYTLFISNVITCAHMQVQAQTRPTRESARRASVLVKQMGVFTATDTLVMHLSCGCRRHPRICLCNANVVDRHPPSTDSLNV